MAYTRYMSYNQYQKAKAVEDAKAEKNALYTRNQLSIDAEKAAEEQAAEVAAAAQAKVTAANNVLAQQEAQYQESKTGITDATTAAQEGLYPWRDAGVDALGQLTAKIEAGPGEYTQSPGYEAAITEGQRAIERSAAASGNALSGAAIKSATRYGENYALQDYDNFLQQYYDSLAPLQDLSSTGLSTAQQIGNYETSGATQLANLGATRTDAMGQTQLYSGEAEAEGKINTSNVLAAQKASATERDYAYQAWKAGKDF